MVKSKTMSQDGSRLKKMPPDNASGTIPVYSVQGNRYVVEPICGSPESSDHDEPEKKSKHSEEVNRKPMSSSNEEIRYPSIPFKSGSLAENRNGNGEKRLSTPAESENLQQKSQSRTPSPVKKLQSFAARSKAAEEVRTAQIAIPEADFQSSNRDTSRPNAAADSKLPTSSDVSRERLDDRDRPLPPAPATGQRQDSVHTAARSSKKDKPPTRDPLLDPPRLEPKPIGIEKVRKGLVNAIYGQTSTYYDPRQELNDLKTALSNTEYLLKESEMKLKEQKLKVHDLQYSLAMAEEARDDSIRKQQEANFKQMDTGRWLPQEESKIKGNLDRLKRSMKSWSKDFSINSMTPIQNLMGGTDEEIAFTQCLSNVVRMDDGRLPPGLNTSKTPSLLLNALLADNVYKTIFENPFFFLRDQHEYEAPRLAPDEKFNQIYQWMLVNGREAHIWRSQTLRLLYPPLRESSTDEESNLYSSTDSQIARVSEWQADRFVDGPARHLIYSDPEGQSIQRVKAIYNQAAELSYQLWARRTSIKCITLREMRVQATFELDSPYMEPHTLVRYDDHPDHLFGKPFTIVVHPIVEAFGTDEGEGYDQKGRVWAKAVVWLDSRIDSRRPQ